MKIFALFFVLLLCLVVFGAIGFFSFKLFVEPAKDLRAERAASLAAADATPTPDPSLPDFEKIMTMVDDPAQFDTAVESLHQFMATHPRSTVLGEAKAALGELNASVVFSTKESPTKQTYSVVSGDSLIRIASHTNSNPELIMRSNNLQSIDLQIGQVLQVPQLDIAIVVDRATSTLTVFNHNRFFKEYALLGPAGGSEEIDTTVKEKIATRDGRRVIFGSVEFPGSNRSIVLAQGGLTLRGSDASAASGGVVVSQYDIEEIFPLVTRGTRVIIR